MSLAQRLRGGERAFGCMIRLTRSPAITAIAREAGLDYVMVDLEHGAYSLETVADMALAAKAAGLGFMARAPELTRHWISGLLDLGVEGIMVPMLETPAQARQLVAWAKYPPLGGRGLSTTGGHTCYRKPPAVPEFMAAMNRDVLTIAQIETATAIENAAAIAAVDGLDALLIGPNDLAVSLGHPGELQTPDEDAAIAQVAAATQAAGKVFGIHASADFLARWREHGLRLVMNGIDASLLASALERVNRDSRKLFA